MRSEAVIFDLILNFARREEGIRLVFLNGSRANPKVKPDRFRDFDIVFLVKDMSAFLENDDWLDVFGKRLIMQKPETMQLFPPEGGKAFPYLMLFEDGNRIDLQILRSQSLKNISLRTASVFCFWTRMNWSKRCLKAAKVIIC